MSCEIYNDLTDNSLLSGTGPLCRYRNGCPRRPENCKWGPLLRAVAKNMAIEDTPEDIKHDEIVSELEKKRAIEDIVSENQMNSLVSISRVN